MLFADASFVTAVQAPPAAIPPRPALTQELRPGARVFGRVTDLSTGKPIRGALVQQAESLANAFTDSDGRFDLMLDADGVQAVQVSAGGYATRRLDVAGGGRLTVSLEALRHDVTARPAVPMQLLPSSSAEQAPLNSGISAAYRLRTQTITQGGASISGAVTNEFRLGLRLRLAPWLFEGEGGHYQSAIELPTLTSAQNPAFRPSAWQAGLRAGYLWRFSEDLEAAVQGGYRYRNVAPNNNDIPYTGTGLDVTQTQHAFGPVGVVGWKPFGGNLVLEGALGIYPLMIAYGENGVGPLAGSNLLDGRLGVAYEVTTGLRAGLQYQHEAWRGVGADVSHVYSVQLHYTPAGLPQGEGR
jgi:hypothetical protein